MRKVLGVLIIVLLVSSAGYGAEWKRVGLQAGLVSANLTGRSKNVNTDPRFGRYGRISIGIAFDETYNLESGIAFIEKGWRVTNGDTTDVYNLDYLEVPIIIRINLRQTPAFQSSAFVGLVWGYNLNGTRETSSPQFNETTALDWVRKDEFSITTGIGIAIPTGVGTFTLDARYQLGFTTTVKNTTPDFNIDWRNETVALIIGYMLR